MAEITVGIIVAGGLARRMGGGDKPLRLLGGAPLLDHVVQRVAPQVAALALNANGDAARFACWNLPVLPDTLEGNPGPLAGVLAGMRWARSAHPDATYLLSVPGDTPFLPRDLLARLRAARGSARIVCAATGGQRHFAAALWPVDLADALDVDLRAGMRKMEHWMDAHGLASAAFDDQPDGIDPFFNVNRPEELAEAEASLARRG